MGLDEQSKEGKARKRKPFKECTGPRLEGARNVNFKDQLTG